MKNFKYLLSYKKFSEGIDYSNDQYPQNQPSSQLIARSIPVDGRSEADKQKNTNFQPVQNELQKQHILPELLKVGKNYTIQDAERISDDFFKKTKGKLKEIVDKHNGDIQGSVDAIWNTYGKKIINNYINKEDRNTNPQKAINQPDPAGKQSGIPGGIPDSPNESGEMSRE